MSVRNLYPQQRPTLNLNFAQSKILDPRITFTRTSTATYVDEDGFIKTVDNDVARFDFDPVTGECLGLLIEEQRTNSINNNTMVGALVGTPGTPPTSWGIGTNNAELTHSIVGVGVESGISYIDVRVSGTVTASRACDIQQAPDITASNGQTWTHSVYLRQVGGSQTNITDIRIQGNVYSSTAYLTTPWFHAVPVTTESLITQRRVFTATLVGETITRVRPFIKITTASSGIVDFTLRIGMPQLELGSFATSLIPTEGSTKIRTPDNAYIEGTLFNQFYNLSEGSVFCSFSSPTPYGRTNATPFVFSIDRNTIGWGHYVSSGGSSISLFRDPTGTNVAFLNTAGSPTVVTTDQIRKLSVGYKQNDFVQYVNVGNGVISERTDPSGQVRTDINAFAFNPQHSGLRRFGGHIQKFVYYPTKFTNTQIRNLAL